MSTTTDLSTLKINYLTQAQYESAVSGGTVDPDQIYLTPASGTGVTDVEVDGSSVVSGGVAEIDLTGKADATHTHTKSQITDFPTIPTVTDTYSSTSSNAMSGKAVNSALGTLDGTVSGTAGSGKTLTAFSQTDGKVSATFGNISITKSQVSDFPTIHDVPSGGTSGQVLTKNTNTDYDLTWTTPSGGGGGTTNYSDLTNKPSINSVTLSGNKTASDLSLASASHTHGKADITDFPTIPTVTDTYNSSSSNAMSGKAVNSALGTLDGTVSGSAGSSKTLTAFSQTDGKVSATFGNISITKSQISDFPAIPTITDTYSSTSSDGMSGKAVKSAIDALDGTISGTAGASKTLTAFSQTDGKVSATFGNISITKSQISDFPTIPTVNNATLTIQKNGTTVNSFTANASSDVTANISVPSYATVAYDTTESLATATDGFYDLYTPTKKGIYIGYIHIAYPSNSTGRRATRAYTKVSGTRTYVSATDSRMAVSAAATDVVIPIYCVLNANETLGVRAYQNCGSSLSITVETYGVFMTDY